MAMSQNEVCTIGATRIPVGLSQVIRIKASEFQYSSTIKLFSGSSLELVAPQLSGTSTAAGNAWGFGYLIGNSETLSWDGSPAIYLAATGATAVVHMTIGYTFGATFL